MSIRKHIPNTITCLSLLSGCVASVMALHGNFLSALIWIIIAAVFDFCDGFAVITTRNGVDVLARQIAGAMARRIVTYAKPGEKCHVDEQMGFIKFGSRVDVYLPVGTEVLIEMDQKVTGNQTPIARLSK